MERCAGEGLDLTRFCLWSQKNAAWGVLMQEQMAFLSLSLTCCQLLLAAQGGPCTTCAIVC